MQALSFYIIGGDKQMKGILETTLRATIGFFVLLILTRIIGKKQMGQFTIFTYITGIALGNIAGDMVVHKDVTLADGITGLTVWTLFTLIVEFISLKLSKARILLDGEPAIVIKKGEIMQDTLTANRLNMDDLTMLLRTNNVFSIAEVEYAILEPNGQLSVMKKQDKKANSNFCIPTEIIVDGALVEKNILELGLDNLWVDNLLKQAGITSAKDVFYAELQGDGSLYISKKTKKIT